MFKHANKTVAFFNGKIMENIASEDLAQFPITSQSFQANNIVKVDSKFMTPNYVQEQSGELNNTERKVEDPIHLECLNSNCMDETSQSTQSDGSSVASTIIPVDNSYLLDCEKRILEYSGSDDDKNNQSTSGSKFFNIKSRKLGFENCIISTPPSELRQEIYALRDEIMQSDEFHDLEIQVLLENLDENQSKNCKNLIEKYSSLMELYTSLKKEYENYRNEQENFKQEIHSKTTDYLETLCSQIEASDGSTTFSDASFASFSTEVKSSTMIEYNTEKEITLVNNTLLTRDPLSFTVDNTFKTPKMTPLKSCKKILNLDLTNSKTKSVSKEPRILKSVLIDKENLFQFNSKLLSKISDLETYLHKKNSEIKELEQRLFTVENLEKEMRCEYDRKVTECNKEVEELRKNLKVKNSELEELTQKLMTETTALNPSLKETLVEAPVSRILSTFIETIIEGCQNIQNELIKKYDSDKFDWEKQKQNDSSLIEELLTKMKILNENYEAVKSELEKSKLEVSQREKELNLFQSSQQELNQIQDNFQEAQQTISQLRGELEVTQREKAEAINKCKDLEKTTAFLEEQLNSKKNKFEAIPNLDSCFDKVKLENARLLLRVNDLENLLMILKEELITAKKESIDNDKLTNEIHSIREENDSVIKILESLSKNKKSIAHLYKNFNKTQEEMTLLYKQLKHLLQYESNGKSEWFLSTISEIIIDCCDSARSLLKEEISNKSRDWENQAFEDQKLIQKFQIKTENLESEIQELQAKLGKLDALNTANENLKEKIKDNELIILKKNEEINCLKELESENFKISKSFSELQEKVQDLQSQLIHSDNCKEEIMARCQIFKDENAALQIEIEEKENKIKDIEAHLLHAEELRIISNDFKEAFEKSEEVVKSLKEELEEMKNEKNRWENEKTNDLNVIESLQNELKVLRDKDEKTEIIDKCFKLEEIISVLEAEVKSKENHLNDLQKTLSECADSNNNLKLIIKKLEEESASMESEMEAAKQSLLSNETLLTEIDSLKKEKNKLHGIFNFCKDNKKFMTDYYSKNYSNLDDLSNVKIDVILDKFNTSFENCKENVVEKYFILIYDLIFDCCKSVSQKLSKSFEEQEVTWEKEKESNKAMIDDLQTHLNSIKEKLIKNEEKMRDLESVKELQDIFKKKFEEAESIIAEKHEQINLLESVNNKLLDELSSAQDIITKLRCELNTVSENQSKTSNNFQTMEKLDLDFMNKNLEEARIALRFVIGEKECLLKDLENIKLCNKELSEKTENFKTIIKRLEEALEEAKDLNSLQEKEKKNNLNYIENLQNELSDLRGEIKNKEIELQKLESTHELVNKLEKEMAEIKAALKTKIEEIDVLNSLKSELYDELQLKRDKIVKLESELEIIRNTLKETENEHRRLEDIIQSKEILLKDLEIFSSRNEQLKIDKENLKSQLVLSENVILELNKELSFATEKLKQNEVILNEMTSLKKEISYFKNLFEILKESQKTLAKYSMSWVGPEGTIDGFSVLLDKMTNLFKDPHPSEEYFENEPFLKIITDTVSSCCRPLQNELKNMYALKKEKENCMETLKGTVDSLSCANDLLKGEVTAMAEEIEKLKDERKDLSCKVVSLEENNSILSEILSDIQSRLEMPSDTITKLLSGSLENRKIFSDSINKQIKNETEVWKVENMQLKMNIDSLKEKVKEFNQMINEVSKQKIQESTTLNNSKASKHLPSRSMELCTRRMDKLENLNQNLTELITLILTLTEFPNLEKLKFISVRDYPNISKKVKAHFDKMVEKFKDLEEMNGRLDEECDSYAKTIKDLKKEAVTIWKSNKDKAEALESEIKTLKDENKILGKEKCELLAKVSKLDSECLKWKNATAKPGESTCNCSNELKKIYDLKRTILVKEQKILELQEFENQNSVYRSQIKYLENALEQEKKKMRQEKEKIKKLQTEVEELTKKDQKEDKKTSEESELMDELRVKGSLTGGIVQEFFDKEKMRKLSKEIGILKELCRARYVEIKRLEVENTALKKSAPKNSNQMDSPVRVKLYNTRSKVNAFTKEIRLKLDVEGKENRIQGDPNVL